MSQFHEAASVALELEREKTVWQNELVGCQIVSMNLLKETNYHNFAILIPLVPSVTFSGLSTDSVA